MFRKKKKQTGDNKKPQNMLNQTNHILVVLLHLLGALCVGGQPVSLPTHEVASQLELNRVVFTTSQSTPVQTRPPPTTTTIAPPSAQTITTNNTSSTPTTATTTATTTTTTTKPADSSPIDGSQDETNDPSGADTESEEYLLQVCDQCHRKVLRAQELISAQVKLVRKHDQLLKQKSQQRALPPPISSSSSSSSPRRPKVSRSKNSENLALAEEGQQQQVANLSGSVRHLDPAWAANASPVVISTLRVARSAPEPDQVGAALARANGNLARGKKSSKFDQELKQVKCKQEQQLKDTCRSLREVKECLEELSQECLGDLRYHSNVVFARQWLIRLECRSKEDPHLRPYSLLTRTLSLEKEPQPLARPLSSRSETQAKLDAIFGGGLGRGGGLGVMLGQQTKSAASVMGAPVGVGGQRRLLVGGSLLEGPEAQIRAIGLHQPGRHLLGERATVDHLSMIPLAGQVALVLSLVVVMGALVSLAGCYLARRDESPKVAADHQFQ